MAKIIFHKQEKPVALEIRAQRGSRQAQALRAGGKLPGIIYGLGQAPVAITLPHAETVAVLQSGAHILDATLDGKQEKMLIQEVQYDYLQTTVTHIDLLRIDPNQRVHVKVALEFRGTPKGAKEGGILEIQTNELEVEVLALQIPDSIRVNVEHLELHQIMHAREISLPPDAKLIDFAEKIICQVRTVKEEVAVVEAAPTAAEPELIGKKKEEEGAEGAAAPEAAKGATPGGGAKAAAPAKAAAAPAKK